MKTLVIFILSVLIFACDKKNDDLLKKNAIDSTIKIDTREYLDTRQLVLFCQTERKYPCFNYPIQKTQNFNASNQLSITFTNIIETDICLTAFGPATTTVDLSNLTNGQYVLELNNASIKNKGILKISDSAISLDFNNQNGIEISTPITKRIPAGTYWGTIGFARISSESSVNEFIDKLKAISTGFNKQSPGYYFHYEIDNNGEMIIDVKNSGYYYVKGMVFQYAGDESKLKDLIQIAGKEYYADDIYISLWTYNGDHFYNWGK